MAGTIQPVPSEIIAILDTNVLMRLRLTSFLLQVSAAGAFVARWTQAIEDALRGKLASARPEVESSVLAAITAVPDANLSVEQEDATAAQDGCHRSWSGTTGPSPARR